MNKELTQIHKEILENLMLACLSQYEYSDRINYGVTEYDMQNDMFI